ncbi:MAG: sigma factor-like helix-turn-helix DNA-binding protein [Patescibacteria group bacterium]
MRIEIRGAEELSFRERQAVVLKETGHGIGAIARHLGVSEATVATLLHRARGKGYEVVIVLPGSALGLADEAKEESEHGNGEPPKRGDGPA